MRAINTTRSAFSLVELMFVLAIMAVLAGVVALNLRGTADKAKEESTKLSMNTVAKALELYEVRHNAFPPSSMGLQALVTNQQLKTIPEDAWNRVFSYQSPTVDFAWEIQSSGKDGQWNTPDDIRFTPNDSE